MGYGVISDYAAKPGDTYVSSDPYWIVAVWRLQEPVTYSRFKMGSFTNTMEDGVKVRGTPLIITDDCLQLQVATSKSNYISSLSASLIHSGHNYLSDIFPGDYVAAWMFTNANDYAKVLYALGNKEPCNGFNSGLKFWGKVQSLRRHLFQAPDGHRQVRYQLNASGFKEFDAQIFYDPHLAAEQDKTAALYAQFGQLVNDLINEQQKGIDTKKAVSKFLELMLGKGIPLNENLSVKGQPNQITTGLSAGYPYIIPGVFGEFFGIEHDKEKQFLTFSDVLEKLVGLQEYAQAQQDRPEGEDPKNQDKLLAKPFIPSDTRNLLGTMSIMAPQLTNKPVWSVLKLYSNSAINEMYTTLRVNSDGRIMPTFVCRQLPFTSEYFDFRSPPPQYPAEASEKLDSTKFLNLPRWVLDPVLVKAADIGRSESLRFNFVHVYGDGGGGQAHAEIYKQIIRNPPIRDELDIARNGLSAYMTTVPAFLGDVVAGAPAKWMALVSDIVMGQHLTLTGVVQSFGIQSPICVGDNLEWEGAVFHIEAITHTCAIGPDGAKTFSTQMNLSHGVHDVTKEGLKDIAGESSDLQMYAAINIDDFSQLNPGVGADIRAEDIEREGKRDADPGTGFAQENKRAKEEYQAEKERRASENLDKLGETQFKIRRGLIPE